MKRVFLALLFAASVGAQSSAPPPTTGICGNGCIQMFANPPRPRIMIGGDQILNIQDKDGKLMVHIDLAGKVTYGEGYKPDDSAQLFWQVLGDAYPQMCVEYEKHRKPNPTSYRVPVRSNEYLSIKIK